MRAPIDSPVMADFVAQLDAINALADDSPGFIWRLKGAGNDATSLRPFADDFIIVNMSVWEGIDVLRQYVYRGDHVRVLRERGKWFEKMGEAHMVLWWVPAGHIPSVAEARDRLIYLREHGESPETFTFQSPFAPA